MQNTIKYPAFEEFMVSGAGRATRILIGLGMIGTGLSLRKPSGYALAAVGLGPFLAGTMDLCLLGPALGGSFKGDEMRRQLAESRRFTPTSDQRSQESAVPSPS